MVAQVIGIEYSSNSAKIRGRLCRSLSAINSAAFRPRDRHAQLISKSAEIQIAASALSLNGATSMPDNNFLAGECPWAKFPFIEKMVSRTAVFLNFITSKSPDNVRSGCQDCLCVRDR